MFSFSDGLKERQVGLKTSNGYQAKHIQSTARGIGTQLYPPYTMRSNAYSTNEQEIILF